MPVSSHAYPVFVQISNASGSTTTYGIVYPRESSVLFVSEQAGGRSVFAPINKVQALGFSISSIDTSRSVMGPVRPAQPVTLFDVAGQKKFPGILQAGIVTYRPRFGGNVAYAMADAFVQETLESALARGLVIGSPQVRLMEWRNLQSA